MAIDIGRIAYQNYIEHINSDNFREERLWEELTKIECDAWRHAAVAVLQHIEQERKQYEVDKLEDADGFEM
jgi:hypothetical protein